MTKPDTSLIGLSLYTKKDLRNSEFCRYLLNIFFNYGREFAPEQVDYGMKWKKIREDNLPLIIDNCEKVNNLLFRREQKYQSETALLIGDGPSIPNGMTNWIDESYFMEEGHIERYINISKLFYELFQADYGLIHQTLDKIKMATIQDPKFGRTVLPINLNKGLPGIYWANFFGPKYVNLIGRNKLLSAPCFKVTELQDGGILIIISPSPLYPDEEENRKKQLAFRIFLGEPFFYPKSC
jgi:hypothetical protein